MQFLLAVFYVQSRPSKSVVHPVHIDDDVWFISSDIPASFNSVTFVPANIHPPEMYSARCNVFHALIQLDVKCSKHMSSSSFVSDTGSESTTFTAYNDFNA